MSNKKQYLNIFGIAALVILIDQISKYIVRTNLKLREVWAPIPALKDFFRIIHWKNTGVAFGMFQGRGWILTVIGIIAVVVIIIFCVQVKDSPAFYRTALAMELGGALGNLIDRLNPSLGYVVDFIWIGNFPVFNLADSAICIGAAVLIIGIWREESKKKNTETETETKNE